MKNHYHLGIDHALMGAISTAIIFHGFRFLAAKIAKQPSGVGSAGKALGGVFTFGGMS